jgi:hypothetical protein
MPKSPAPHRRAMPLFFVPLALLAVALGCGGAGTIVAAETDGMGAEDVLVNSVPPVVEVPAFIPGDHRALPQVLNAGGNTMAAPTLCAVTFDGDANAFVWEAFVEALPKSTYWQATTAEYGIDAATPATPIRSNMTLQGSLTDGVSQRGEASDIETFLIAQLDGTLPPWGAPSASTLYVLFLPPGVLASDDGAAAAAACADGLAWHTAMLLPRTQVTITYAVVPDCGPIGPHNAQDSRTLAASHAIIGALTNPRLDAYAAFDANNLHWTLAAGNAEVTAACVAALHGDANFAIRPDDLGYLVQRSWSNVAAAAGHNPCVPAPPATTAAYFAAVPRVDTTISAPLGVNLLNPTATTAGISVAAGGTVDVALDLFSDGALLLPWQVTATEVNSNQAVLTLHAAGGNNGDTIVLTVGSNAGASGRSLVRITSTLGNSRNSTYLLVAH